MEVDMSITAIIGKRIAHLAFEHDAYVITFDDDSVLTVVNFVGYYGSQHVGKTIAAIRESDELMHIDLDDGSEMAISLRPNDYIGPEAFIYVDKSKGIIVVD